MNLRLSRYQILTLLTALILANVYPVVVSQSSSVKVEQSENEIAITTVWDRRIVLNLIYHEPEGIYESEINITIYLNMVATWEK